LKRVSTKLGQRGQRRILATLSHEFRTPLNAILGWTPSAIPASDGHDRPRHEAIERNAKTQVELIEDMLDVSRIITGRLRLDMVPVLLTEVVEASMDSVRPAARPRRASQYEKMPDNPVVSGDSAGCSKSFGISYRTGEIHACFRSSKSNWHTTHPATVTVSDTGGIAWRSSLTSSNVFARQKPWPAGPPEA
jgi:signal transduction histidine kinase